MGCKSQSLSACYLFFLGPLAAIDLPVIHFTNVSKNYGNKVLYQNASFMIRPNDKIGLVGPNGAGKTTVFRLIMGEENPESGEISRPDRLVIGYFSQDVGEMKGRSALEEVLAGAGRISELAAQIKTYEKQLEASGITPLSDDEMTSLLEKYGEVQTEFEQRGGYDLEARAKEILTGLGISPEDHQKPVEQFSGGWKMRIALAKILALNPDVLLADEPTNHLDVESIIWLEEWLKNFKGAIVMTSHDRDFMNRIVTRIVEVANKTLTVYSGNYDFYLREREIRREQLEASFRKQQDMLAKEEEFIARFAARASHAAQVQSRVKKLEKIDRIEIPAEEKSMAFSWPACPRSGNDVVKIDGLGKTFELPDGRKKTVFQKASGVVRRLDRVAVVGINGAGKSTLLKIMAGELAGSEGKCELGASINLGYFSQHALEVLNPSKSIYDEVHDRIPHATLGYVRNLLGAFLFSGDDIYKKIGILSGGEKSRVVLATILASPVNVLILDEPTNHLDIRAREVLMEALKQFDGTVIMVSHDRYFLRELVTRVFELDHGEMRIYEGDFEYYRQTTGRLMH
jgi:ATP-binding cassette subfamily F protein 3